MLLSLGFVNEIVSLHYDAYTADKMPARRSLGDNSDQQGEGRLAQGEPSPATHVSRYVLGTVV